MISTVSLPTQAQESQGGTTMQEHGPTSSGYAEAAEGLRIYYETYGEGEPIAVLAGVLMPIRTTAQITRPLWHDSDSGRKLSIRVHTARPMAVHSLLLRTRGGRLTLA
jgi:hypothetical protein